MNLLKERRLTKTTHITLGLIITGLVTLEVYHEIYCHIIMNLSFNLLEIGMELTVFAGGLGLIFKKRFGWIIIHTILFAILIDIIFRYFLEHDVHLYLIVFSFVILILLMLFNLRETIDYFEINKKTRLYAYCFIIVIIPMISFYHNSLMLRIFIMKFDFPFI